MNDAGDEVGKAGIGIKCQVVVSLLGKGYAYDLSFFELSTHC